MTRRDPAPQGSQGHRPTDWVPSGPACGYAGEGLGEAAGADRCVLGCLSSYHALLRPAQTPLPGQGSLSWVSEGLPPGGLEGLTWVCCVVYPPASASELCPPSLSLWLSGRPRLERIHSHREIQTRLVLVYLSARLGQRVL